MSRPSELAELVTKEHFRQIESAFRKNFNMAVEITDIDGNEVRSICSENCHPEFCRMVRDSRTAAGRCRQDRLRSLNIATETGQPYIPICHAGIVLVCVPVMDSDTPLGGIFFGKCLPEPFSSDIEQDIFTRLKGLRFNATRLADAAGRLAVVSAGKIHQAAEFLFILLYEVTGLEPPIIHWRREKTIRHAHMSEFIHQNENAGDCVRESCKAERELVGKVKIGDRVGAKEIFDSLVESIMLQAGGDLNVLKARLVELLSILSRAAAEGGVDINSLLEKNLDYFNRVMSINTRQDLCAWAGVAIEDFIDSVYKHQDRRKMTQIRPAIDYIQSSYDQPVNLADIAGNCHLSVSRFAHLFKEQMGITVIEYLTSVRISHAKRLLISTDKSCTKICFDVGYDNQSYFTRTFRELVGMTPRQFRDKNQRPQTRRKPSADTFGRS